MADDTVTLAIDGQRHEGWTSIEIGQSLDDMVGQFALELTSRWPGQPERIEMEAGVACALAIGGETLMTGWIDDFEPSYDANSFNIRVSGRDRASDLVDCSAVHKPGSWRNVKLETIAAELAQPFGVAIASDVDTGPPVKRFALQQGETVFDAIERLARYRALLPVSQPDGSIRLIAPATGPASVRLVEGEHLLSAAARHSANERFSQVIVKGQASGDDQANGKAVAAAMAEAKDGGVKRYRPLIVIGEEQSDRATLETRAKWEVTTRAARAQAPEVTVQGWRDGAGAIWRVNRLVRLVAPMLQIDADLLVSGVTLRKANQGTTAALTLARPEAFSQQPVTEKAALSELAA